MRENNMLSKVKIWQPAKYLKKQKKVGALGSHCKFFNTKKRERERDLARRNAGALSDKRPCTNHSVFLNHSTVKQYGTHPDKCVIFYCACMQNRTMTYIKQSFIYFPFLSGNPDNLGTKLPQKHHHDHISVQYTIFQQNTPVRPFLRWPNILPFSTP